MDRRNVSVFNEQQETNLQKVFPASDKGIFNSILFFSSKKYIVL